MGSYTSSSVTTSTSPSFSQEERGIILYGNLTVSNRNHLGLYVVLPYNWTCLINQLSKFNWTFVVEVFFFHSIVTQTKDRNILLPHSWSKACNRVGAARRRECVCHQGLQWIITYTIFTDTLWDTHLHNKDQQYLKLSLWRNMLN